MTEQMPPVPESLPTERLDAIAAKHAGPSRPLWREPAVWVALGAVLAAIAAVALYTHAVSGQARHDANAPCAPKDSRAACVAAARNAAGISQANRRLTAHGLPAVSTPAAVPVPSPVTTTVTAPAGTEITDAMLDAAAERYFQLHPPPSGKAAVVDYQALRDFIAQRVAGITPPSGPSGPAGQSGASGQPGADLTQAQADQAVADYCAARNNCQGPQGESGAPASPGPACPTGYTQTTVTPRPLESPGETWVVCDSTGG
jgi:hypothetical protein